MELNTFSDYDKKRIEVRAKLIRGFRKQGMSWEQAQKKAFTEEAFLNVHGN